ncbi:MAG: hypothetical protein OHK93_001312 [Ramalina farinacea]|uniref:FAM86 N-terminal domain-containing protein n=1 Tax=Ramalina farinacea TaxID=258253 RepID=A0AA43TZD3_9LECA|nr:hypothetical protein [Ramalina farinacea]
MTNCAAVELLRRQYLQLIDPERLKLPPPEVLRSPDVQRQIYESMFDDTAISLGPSLRYRLRVLKRLIRAIEDSIQDPEEDEISDDLSGCLAQYMSQSLPSAGEVAQQKSYVTYTAPFPAPNDYSVILSEAPSLLASSGTTGFRTWEAALHLASFLCTTMGRTYVAGKNVLELGAGTGFLSILYARYLEAKYVLATDGSHLVVQDMNANLALNGFAKSESLEVRPLQWGHALLGGPADQRDANRGFDTVIGADVTYDMKVMPALIATVRDLFELYPSAKFLISATIRNEETLNCFLKACDANNFIRKEIDFPLQSFEDQTGFFITGETPIKIFELRAPVSMPDAFAL